VLGLPVIVDLHPTIERLVEAAEPAEAASVDVRVPLPDGRVVAGTVPGVSGDEVRAATFSRLAAKHRLAAWVRLLALSAGHPGRSFGARTVGRAAEGAGVVVAQLGPLPPEVALAHLVAIVDLHDRGLREPLPVACASSAAYAQAVAAGEDAGSAAASKWTTAFRYDGEDRDPAHALVWGERAVDDLLAEAALPDEAAWGGEPRRFAAYARRLWEPLLAAEELTAR
jgi:exodeoxyribonuclease V gamma subunit